MVEAAQDDPDIRKNTFLLLLGDPKAFPGQIDYIVTPVGSGSALGSPGVYFTHTRYKILVSEL